MESVRKRVKPQTDDNSTNYEDVKTLTKHEDWNAQQDKHDADHESPLRHIIPEAILGALDVNSY